MREHIKDQTRCFQDESYRFVSSNIKNINRSNYFSYSPKSLAKDKIDSILDVGCGNGERLNEWRINFESTTAVGIEPSEQAVELLNDKWNNVEEISFISGYAHSLPFETDTFDLVTAWSVLSWVGRPEYIQSIGELIRVCSKYLCIVDFCASKDYRVPYSHEDGLYTYKQDFDPIVCASGIMKSIEVKRWWPDPETKKRNSIEESDLKKFELNKLSYFARKLVVYEKNYNLLPIKSQIDFE